MSLPRLEAAIGQPLYNRRNRDEARSMNPDAPSTRQPAITAPVSRSLAVADTARSAAFYRDVLAFAIHQTPDGMEATNGPARLHFDVAGPAPAVVFFETGRRRRLARRHPRPRRPTQRNRQGRTGSRCGCSRCAIRTGTRCGSASRRRVPDAASPRPCSKRPCRNCRWTMSPRESPTIATCSVSR